ncbi:MAG TPA: sterol desaturase family protein [Bryobacteraceae bacterium]|nr:sterol desaturase family protein [Bryobacteraceae bacterium]
MEQYLTSHEASIAWWLFVAAFVLVALGETFRPRRALAKPNATRWAGNGLLALTHIGVYAIYPLGTTMVAVLVSKNPYGLLNGPRTPFALRFVVAVILLDLLRYGVHYLFHGIPVLWRIHQVHHSDPDFDLTTGVRNHPGEVFLIQGVYLAAVALTAPPPLAVLVVGFATAMQNLFSHANLNLPTWIEGPLRYFLITPDVHRIHHSDRYEEQNTNFGFLFPWWDRLFRTYCAAPALEHDKMGIGLQGFQDDRSMNPLHLLAMPFRIPISPSNEVREPD